uniref:Protein OBERON 3 n=1 Tax=Anthurium amnicola TaxID=1678845 RepID=A0A1D1XN62_9ARAE
MFLEADLPQSGEPFAPDVKPSRHDLENPDRKIPPFDKGGEKKVPTSQELTLSYLCDNPHRLMGVAEKEEQLQPGKNLLEAIGGGSSRCGKGKEVAAQEAAHQDRQWVERDFLQLSGGGAHSKREAPEGAEERGKKAKVEALMLSLALPDLALSLSSSNLTTAVVPAAAAATAQATGAAAAQDPPSAVPAKKTTSNNTHNTRASSDDFTASRSYSYYSLPFSHNPSCSLTRNSTENYEYSREIDHIWCAGEGTNGSVHSRFKPIGDANANNISFSNHHGYPRQLNNGKEGNNSLYRGTSSENCSLFPSELPARQRENGRASSDGGRHAGLSRPDRVLREIVSESVSIVAQGLQEIPADSIEAVKEYLKNVMTAPEKRDEFASLKKRLERRYDLTQETLLKAHRTQLDIFVAIKTGLVNFLSGKNCLPTAELVEIFLLSRCKNVNCRSVLPVDDCDCKICSTKKGFCSSCMCPLCLNFDCALNTCSWVGCDVCSHWCHAVCGIQKNLIRPGPCLGGNGGTTEMQFYCLGCDHASEMFGFVKEVFMCCAKDWGLETLTKELDCVRKIFRGSEDVRGKELHGKAEEMLGMLDKKLTSPIDACNNMVQFLKYCSSELSTSARTSKDKGVAQWSQRDDINVRSLPPSVTTATYNPNSSSVCRDALKDIQKVDIKAVESEPALVTSKKNGFESLESIVRFKEAEANLFQRLADDARREVESYRQIARAKSDKLEEEYASKLAKLCLQETEDRRKKKLEELKLLENSHYDYYNMKMRMQAEIACLLERMEATKQQWV